MAVPSKDGQVEGLFQKVRQFLPLGPGQSGNRPVTATDAKLN